MDSQDPKTESAPAEDRPDRVLNSTLHRVRSRRFNHVLTSQTEKCPTRRKVRNLCENLRDQFLSSKAPAWVAPKKNVSSLHHFRHRRKERRLWGETVYVCTESHTSTPDHTFNPEFESKSVHHRKPKWMVDRSCRSTWFAMTLHLTVMIIIIASVLTFIIDSLNYEYCMNKCPIFDWTVDGRVENCSLAEPENAHLSAGGCNPLNNTGVPCDVYSGVSQPAVNLYCTYHVAKGILDQDQIFVLDVLFTIVFAVELLVRALVAETYCSRRKGAEKASTPFFADGLNWCDFAAILPLPMQQLFLELGIDNSLRTEALAVESSAGDLSSLVILLELFKLLRVVRVFKIARHFSGTRVMTKTVQKSFRPIKLTFIVLFLVFTVLGAALMLIEPCFGAPGTPECQFPDLFTAGYFLMITILTVGYGDQTTKTDVGRLVGILCMILGSCFLAMPLAIVGNKFQAAYAQEQVQSSQNDEQHNEHITKAQRKQRMLNEGFIMLGTIDHLQRVAKVSEEERESAIGNIFKTHRVLIKDMGTVFPDLKAKVENYLKIAEEGYDDADDDDDDGNPPMCCTQPHNRAKVAPMKPVIVVGTDKQSSSSHPAFDGVNKPQQDAEASDGTKAESVTHWRDKLWLCMERHDSGKCALAGYIIRHLVVMLALLLCMLMMFHELNRWDESSEPCQRVAASWCGLIHRLPDDWVYPENVMLDASGRFQGTNKTHVLLANPICGNMTCDNGLVCAEDANDTAVIQYDGCVGNSCFVNSTTARKAVKCPAASVVGTETTTTTVYSPAFSAITVTSTVTDFDTSRDYFDSSALSMALMWDATPVCDRLVCKDNSDFAYFASLSQEQINFWFGVSEVFFCCWFLCEFLLRVVAYRDTRKFLQSVSNWLELTCALVAVSEVVIVSVKDAALSFEVWGMPLVADFAFDHVRPLRIIVPLRFLLMARSYSGADVLLETARKAAPKLAIPVFFLMIMLVIFAGIYFALETQMDCHVELVHDNPYDPDAVVFQYVRDVSGAKCDLQDILDGMWLTIVTLTSVGYGRFYPRNMSGQILSVLVAILGAFYMAMPLAIVGTTFYSAYKLKEEARARMHAKDRFIKSVFKVRQMMRRKVTSAAAVGAELHTQSGLYHAEVDILGDYIDMLGAPDTFQPDEACILRVRKKHVVVMNILGHMLATSDLDVAAKGMFE